MCCFICRRQANFLWSLLLPFAGHPSTLRHDSSPGLGWSADKRRRKAKARKNSQRVFSSSNSAKKKRKKRHTLQYWNKRIITHLGKPQVNRSTLCTKLPNILHHYDTLYTLVSCLQLHHGSSTEVEVCECCIPCYLCACYSVPIFNIS